MSAERRRWQTPLRGDLAHASPPFQDYSDLVSYAGIQYNAAHRSGGNSQRGLQDWRGALVQFRRYRAVSFCLPRFATTTGSRISDITVTPVGGKKLVLEPPNFVFQNVALSVAQRTFTGGHKGAIEEFFGWLYNDIAKQFSHTVCLWIPAGELRLRRHHGPRAEPYAINACRDTGVRAYADTTSNHMSGQRTGRNSAPFHRPSAIFVGWAETLQAATVAAAVPRPQWHWKLSVSHLGKHLPDRPSAGARSALEFPAVS